ncbi:MAG: hypothetical protein WDW36_008665 [Sanguina aurantia]
MPRLLSYVHSGHRGGRGAASPAAHDLSRLVLAPAHTLDAVAAHVAVISAQIAALQLDNTRRDTLATAANAELHAMHVLMQSLCRALHPQQPQQLQQQQHNTPTSNHDHVAPAARGPSQDHLPTTVALPHNEQQQQQQWPQLQQALQPTQQATQRLPPPGFPPLSAPSSVDAAQAIPERPAPASTSSLSVNVASSHHPTLVTQVTSESLEELLSEVNASTAPTTFDMGGRTLYHQLGDVPAAGMLVTARDITIRNGILHQSDSNTDKTGPGLHVQGVNFRLEGMVLIGGGYGLLVLPGGSASLSSCAIIGPFVGLGVGDFGFIETPGVAKLEAKDVKVSGCGGRGLSVGKGGQARLASCEFMTGQHHGMFVGGDPRSRLYATDVRCSGNRKRGLCVIAQGKARLTRCDLTGNECGSVFVQELGSVVRHDGCTLDKLTHAQHGGYLHAV